MEATVRVTVELGATTTALLSALIGGAKPTAPAAKPESAKAEPEAKEEKPKAGRPAKTEAPKKEEAAADFDSLDDDAKLEAIKTEVTKHTKKGKSADIKALLTGFDAGRASELDAERYGDFYAAIQRYGKGETVEAILGAGEDDLS
jgi:hypothetical protein